MCWMHLFKYNNDSWFNNYKYHDKNIHIFESKVWNSSVQIQQWLIEIFNNSLNSIVQINMCSGVVWSSYKSSVLIADQNIYTFWRFHNIKTSNNSWLWFWIKDKTIKLTSDRNISPCEQGELTRYTLINQNNLILNTVLWHISVLPSYIEAQWL